MVNSIKDELEYSATDKFDRIKCRRRSARLEIAKTETDARIIKQESRSNVLVNSNIRPTSFVITKPGITQTHTVKAEKTNDKLTKKDIVKANSNQKFLPSIVEIDDEPKLTVRKRGRPPKAKTGPKLTLKSKSSAYILGINCSKPTSGPKILPVVPKLKKNIAVPKSTVKPALSKSEADAGQSSKSSSINSRSEHQPKHFSFQIPPASDGLYFVPTTTSTLGASSTVSVGLRSKALAGHLPKSVKMEVGTSLRSQPVNVVPKQKTRSLSASVLKTKKIQTTDATVPLARESDSDKTLLKCRLCSYSTKNQELLHKHMMSHPKYLPYTCGRCPFRTNSQDKLFNHYCDRQSIFRCPKCTYETITKESLSNHMNCKHPITKFEEKHLATFFND